jgi:hypothetical protein
MVFCWNLMCRAGNMVTVCFSHMAKWYPGNLLRAYEKR